MNALKKMWLIFTGKVYCHQCLCLPAVGFSDDNGVDLCIPCWDKTEQGALWPTAPNKALLFIGDILPMMREWKRKIFHLHSWEHDSWEYPFDSDVDCYSCFDCTSSVPDKGRPPLRWNPFVPVY